MAIPGVTDPLISVIIPALDEAAALSETIAAIQSERVAFEIIVVDAQSSDETHLVATAAGARVISCSRRQRAHQLNLGARQARGSILLFVHADTLLPECGLDQIANKMRDRSVAGGAFTRRYASRSLLLRATCFLAHCRNRTIGWHLGDQAMFARRAAFFHLGGFRDVDQFEDLEFSRRLRGFGRSVTIRPGVISSSRRFSRSGPAATTLRDLMLTIRYLVRGLPEPRGARAIPAAPAYESTKRIRSL